MARADAYQTTDADAQAIERELKDVWHVFEKSPARHVGSPALGARLGEIAAQIADLPLSYDDWQILYRQTLQLSRALRGERQLLSKYAPKEVPMPHEHVSYQRSESEPALHSLPLRELLGSITEKAKLLLQKEVELATTEVKADVAQEIGMVKNLAIGGIALMLGMQMLLVSLTFVLASHMEAWLAALVVAGPFLLSGVVIGLVGWGMRVKKPLDTTRASMKESVEWAKNRLA